MYSSPKILNMYLHEDTSVREHVLKRTLSKAGS